MTEQLYNIGYEPIYDVDPTPWDFPEEIEPGWDYPIDPGLDPEPE